MADLVPTGGREGRSEAASAAAGAAGESTENSSQQWKQSDILDGYFFEKKKRWNFKVKSQRKRKIEHEKDSDIDFFNVKYSLYTVKLFLTVNIFPA